MKKHIVEFFLLVWGFLRAYSAAITGDLIASLLEAVPVWLFLSYALQKYNLEVSPLLVWSIVFTRRWLK